ncbi:High mobility group box domain [Arabidopsis suecica]|uniref:High mobility group box domain n=1 Tax=Arabidopsis suecica TaxID=45249 RepID=A0A8T1ZDU5_ARASU|nr:High mobility group box domain [Arabidopsis suecica]
MAGSSSSKRLEANTLCRTKDGSVFASWKKATSDEPKPLTFTTNKRQRRPPTAFLIFMNDFRKTYTDKNPYINVRDLAKHGVEKWKSLTEKKKKFYLVKAAQLKAEYNKSLENNDANEDVEDEEKEVENTDDQGKEEEEEVLDDY